MNSTYQDSPCNVTAYELERFTNACKEKLSPLIGKRIELNTHIGRYSFPDLLP